jgi:hypothetical protein
MGKRPAPGVRGGKEIEYIRVERARKPENALTPPVYRSEIPLSRQRRRRSFTVPGREDTVGFPSIHRLLSSVALSLFLLLFVGCSDDSTGPRELKPLVGVWEATELVMTNQANPSVSVDLIEEGATFVLSIISNGQYSASLTAFGQSTAELGIVDVSGNDVTITPTQPEGPPLVATWSIQGENLVLDGESEFDFNLDGTREPSFAHIVLKPRED